MELDITALAADPVNGLWRVLLAIVIGWLLGIPLARLTLAAGLYALAWRRDDAVLRERALRTMPRTARLVAGVALGIVGVGAPAFGANATPTVSADRIAIAPVTLAAPTTPAQTPASDPTTAPDTPATPTPPGEQLRAYTVQRGDCLWDIAEQVYDTAEVAETDARWREIWRANRVVIGADPGIITPGMVLRLPGTAA